ncbi:MAG: carbohydrate-binding protein [Cellulosilyticaceae bacterium]
MPTYGALYATIVIVMCTRNKDILVPTDREGYHVILGVWVAEGGTVLEWNQTRAYNGDDRVSYQGQNYTAKWWTKGDIPGESSVWE